MEIVIVDEAQISLGNQDEKPIYYPYEGGVAEIESGE